jgi:two-component system response regulator FixJ
LSTEPTVFVVDDDEAVRKAMVLLLDSVGLKVEAYASAEAFLEGHETSRPGCLVLDVRMPGTSGLALQEMLAARGSDIPIIFITGHGDVPTSVQAMKAHAFDFLEKPFNDQDLLDRIHEAIARDTRTRGERAQAAGVAARIGSLTRREREVMQLLVDGKSNKVMAIELNISEKTVQAHRAKVMEKMQVKSVAALVRMVFKGEPGGSVRRSG